jgi:signal transduction histidine kinase
VLWCDPSRIGQAINNLISNGLKFTETGGTITVQALLHRRGHSILEEAGKVGIQWHLSEDVKDISQGPDSVVIAVTDSGIGIPQKALAQLFNKFVQFRETAARKEKKGTGLGLVIAKGIVEEHGGLIGIASQEGAGTTAYFTVPLKELPA